jgi:tetratricopeptide (TPR) repeat protein
VLQVSVVVCVGWIISVCLHEFGHAIVAYWGGDTSVKDKGYLTLNPLKYTNINLSLLLPLLFLLIGGIALPGAAVYIDRRRLRNRWWQSSVSAAGPIASAIVTLFLALLFQLSLAYKYTDYGWICPALACLIFLQIFVIIINSLPIPSLDGYGVIEPWLPPEIQVRLNKISNQLLLFLFMLLLIVKPFSLFLGSLSTTIAESIGVPASAIFVGFRFFSQSSSILLISLIGLLFLIRRLTRKPHEIWYEKGKALRVAQKYEEAIATFDKAIQNKPDYYEAWFEKGLTFESLKQTERALVCFNKALKISPNHDSAWICWYGVGASQFSLKRYEEALESYKQSIKINSEHYLVWHYTALVLNQLELYEEALEYYSKVIVLKPDFAQAWTHRGCTLIDLESYEEGIISCERAIELEPQDPGAWTEKGRALNYLKKHCEALECYKQAIQLQSYCLAWFGQAKVLEDMQRYEDALQSYHEVAQMESNYDFDWCMQAFALCKLERYDEAFAYCEKSLKNHPNYSFALYCKVCCYVRQNNMDIALETLRQAIQLSPRQIKFYIRSEKIFDPIRENSLFKQIVET